MIKDYMRNKEFSKRYIELMISRLTSASVRFETVDDSTRVNNALMYEANMEALKYLYFSNTERIDPKVLNDLAYIINGSMYDYGFRKINVMVEGSEVERTDAKNIYYQIYSLIENYEKVWVDLDPYLREALFHIIFLRIHPYEDGNGRIARIITSYNLMKLGLAPAIITPHEKNDYNNCIENYEPEVLAEMIRNLSNDESFAIKQLYNKYYPDDYAKILSRQS